MQMLFDADLSYDPFSGMPVFDPSACAPALLKALWRGFCGVADTINTTVATPCSMADSTHGSDRVSNKWSGVSNGARGDMALSLASLSIHLVAGTLRW